MSKSTQKLVFLSSLVVFAFIFGVNSALAGACGGATSMYSYNGSVYLKTCNQRAWGSATAVCPSEPQCVQKLCADEQESNIAQNNIFPFKSMINGQLVDTLSWTCGGTSCSVRYGTDYTPCKPNGGSGPINGVCGSAYHGVFETAPTTNLCSAGTPLTGVSYTAAGWHWYCWGLNGGSSVECFATRPINTCTWTCGNWSACNSNLQTRTCTSSPTPCIGANPYPTSQSCSTAINGQCGSSNGGMFTSQPSSNLCSAGTASSVNGNGPWYWTCNGINGGGNASCSANKVATPTNGICGTANGQSFSSQPTTNLCAAGNASSVSGSGPWYWTCSGQNGGSNASCSAQKNAPALPDLVISDIFYECPDYIKVKYCNNGTSTGSGDFLIRIANGGQSWPGNSAYRFSVPAPGACATTGGYSSILIGLVTGQRAAVTATADWEGRVTESNENNNSLTKTIEAACVIPKNGQCGSSNGGTFTSAPTSNLCSAGNASSVSGSGPWTWTCNGTNGGSNVSWSAQKAVTPINGQCGSSNGGTFTSQPTSGLCTQGNASSVSSSGLWTWIWTCNGTNGGTNASCFANRAITPVTGVCGSANNGTFSSTPTANLCTAGTASSVSGSGPWTWTCNGSNGGGNASCSAQKSVTTCTWTCTNWSACNYGTQTRTCASSPTGCTGSNPYPLSQTCTDNRCHYYWWFDNSHNYCQYREFCDNYMYQGLRTFDTQAQCQAALPVNGQCGTSNNGTFSSTPTANLCSAGTTSSLNGNGPWTWTCNGINGGTTASCSAQKSATNCTWTCTNWSTCNNGTQTRTCSSSPTGCTGSNPYPLSQTCTVFVNGVCGSANNNSFTSQPNSNLCSTGTSSSVTGGGPWYWSCYGSGGGSSESCSAQKTLTSVNGQCGSSNNGTFGSQPMSGLCNAGNASSVSGSGPWTWACYGINGGTNASCSANKTLTPINGQCGSANGATFTTQPTSGLCYQGNESSVSGSGPWTWTCNGANGGTNASCSANKTATPVYGQCGSSNGQYFTSLPTSGLCNSGTESTVSGLGPWYWSCYGANGGTSSNCSANKTATSVDGQCGSANGGIFNNAPTANLCNSGTESSVSGSGPWTWACYGTNGGTNASCSAQKAATNCTWTCNEWSTCNSGTQTRTCSPSPSGCIGSNPYPTSQSCTVVTNGQCGSANGGSFTTQPTANLCNAGNASSLTGGGPWYWTCNGINGGTSVNCSASKTSTSVDGQCGYANGSSYTSQPTGGLCSSGTESSVSGSGPWTWACYGINGGNNASCSAQKSATNCTWSCDNWGTCNSGIQYRNCYPSPSNCTGSNPYQTYQSCNSATNGVCGSASGGYFTSQPTGGLCNSGNSSSVYSSGQQWYWTCYGQNGGSDTSCIAYKNQTNQSPSVYAGSYKTVQSGQNVYMDATASDPQGYYLNYSWNCNNGSLSNYNVLNPTYYAPTVYSDTTYTCTLTVTNTVGMSNSSTVNILVRNNNNYSQGPSAYAGSNKTVQSGQSVYLDASASDPQGSYLTYSWTCNGGSLSNYNVLNPTYYAPNIYSDANYTCTLNVTNNRGQSASSSVSIYVRNGGQYSNLSVSTNDATSVTTSTAVLNGTLNGYNTSGYASARFTYGRSGNLNLTTTTINSLGSNQRFSANLYSLEKAKAYSFRAEAKANNGNTVYGNTLRFITAPDSPYNFNAYFNGSNGINLSWSSGQGACYTVITRKLNSYPVSNSDGMVVYFGTDNSYYDQNIYTNRTYYYRAWSVGCDEGLYSWSDSVYSKKYVSTYTEKPIIYVPPVSVVRSITLNITGRNITQNGATGETVSAAPGEQVEVNVTVSSADTHSLENVILTNVLPANIDNVSDIRLNGKTYTGQVDGTILVGTIPVNQSKTLTFNLKVGSNAGGQTLTDKVNASAKNADTVEDSLQINVSQALAAAASVCESASASTETGGSWWWNLLWLLIGLIVGLIIFLLVYLIVKKMNEKKEQEALAPVYAKDRYFSIQQ